MSLDVYLEVTDPVTKSGSGIWVRENGQQREISWQEWNTRYPDREPVIVETEEDNTVFTANITHNLNKMASNCWVDMDLTLCDCLWQPEEHNITQANQLIEPLEYALWELNEAQEFYERFNPENGWGTYAGLVSFVERYLVACRENPTAKIRVSR
jgi:hypothetical protein